MPQPDPTLNPDRRAWLDSANRPGTDFPIQNLPYGVFGTGGGPRRVGVAIGDMILDLTALEGRALLPAGPAGPLFDTGALNPLMACPPATWAAVRSTIADLLDAAAPARDLPLVAQAGAEMHLPFHVSGFTDFYASREHATNVGTMFRGPDAALMPNWLHMPVGYNGRASTVVVSGTPVRRPLGQLKGPQDTAPRLGPSAKLDIELELGTVIGTPSTMGTPLSMAQARAAIFGHVLLNDWSARDMQVWEYQPLGPFLSKAFATTISPWVVTAAALAPFHAPMPPRAVPLLPYLAENGPGNHDIRLEVDLTPEGAAPVTISRTNARHLYYSPAQQLAHHSLSGCAMRTGDLLGSGTISGPTADSTGSLLERTWNGRNPIPVPGGTRTFLEDGDTVTLRGWCEGAYRIGFGTCAGTILPAPPYNP